jgi:hypothetical protein
MELSNVLIDGHREISSGAERKQELLLAFARDRCASNNVTTRVLKVSYANALDMECASHTGSNTCKELECAVLRKFVDLFTAVFKNSSNAAVAYQKLHPNAVTSYSTTRWLCFNDVVKEVDQQLAVGL